MSRSPPLTSGPPRPAAEQRDSQARKGAAGRIAAAAPLEVSNRKLFAWMFRFVRPVLGLAMIAALWLASWVAVEVLANRQAGDTVNFIQHLHASDAVARRGFVKWITSVDPEAQHLRLMITALAALVATYALLRYLREVASSKMSMEMVFYLREAIYDKVQRVGFGFHDAISSGQLINRALSDLQNVRQFLQTAILTTLEIVLVVCAYIILIYTRNPWLAALSMIPLPIWTWYILRFSKKIQPVARSVMEAEDRNVSIITETIAGVHVVKAFATERQEIAKYSDNCATFKQRVLKRIRLFADFNPMIRSIAQASYLILFFAAAVLSIKGKLGPGDFLILGGAMASILSRLQAVATINEQYQNAIVSARRLHEVLMAPPTVPEKPHAKSLNSGSGEVVFDHVTFGYLPDKPVLHDVNFRIPGGSVVAIVGPTGAGKSTLVNLISRFYDATRGKVLIDGMDLRDTRISSLRTQIAFVFQETYLFSDTVAANIAYGRPKITPGEIEAAARLAQAHDFIEQMPKGYHSILSERGSSLSGGQKQRLAIARAIVTNPRVLILDDATAAIDPETEQLIRRGMKFVMHERTTFIIAHRISTVKAADIVIVLEQGRVTQMGTHAQLMLEDGHYQEIADAQLRTDEEIAEEAAAAEAAETTSQQAELQPSHMDRVQDARILAAAAAESAEKLASSSAAAEQLGDQA